MFTISADDWLYGNGAGGPPPLGPLEPYKNVFVDIDAVSKATDYNASLHTHARIWPEGTPCSANVECKSGICVSKIGGTTNDKVCVLDELGPKYAAGTLGTSLNDAARQQSVISSPYWRPVAAALVTAAASFSPLELSCGGVTKHVAGPQYAFAAGATSFVVRSAPM